MAAGGSLLPGKPPPARHRPAVLPVSGGCEAPGGPAGPGSRPPACGYGTPTTNPAPAAPGRGRAQGQCPAKAMGMNYFPVTDNRQPLLDGYPLAVPVAAFLAVFEAGSHSSISATPCA